ncbi:2-thiouracil desulfurase family protein [Thermincola ferriacetica]
MIIVSACLAGIKCKYSGGHYLVESIYKLVQDGRAVPVCPEELGGLPTPRNPAEIIGGAGADVLSGKARVVDCAGQDVTEEFIIGARKVLELARRVGAVRAILKERSPSCGCSMIYDGSFQQKKRPGAGVTTALLRLNGIEVRSEEELGKT